eukprot:7268071-Alexandrium_andersonii.AAC.1
MGAGIWCPSEGGQRPADLVEQAQDFAWRRQSTSGVELWTKFSGARPSSTRAEALGLLLATMLDLPIQVGIDNSAVVTRAQAILS